MVPIPSPAPRGRVRVGASDGTPPAPILSFPHEAGEGTYNEPLFLLGRRGRRSCGSRRLRSRDLLFFAGAGEDAGQRVVAFVAGVLVERIRRGIHVQLAAPRLRERIRILDGELITNLVRRDARQALDDLRVVRSAAE